MILILTYIVNMEWKNYFSITFTVIFYNNNFFYNDVATFYDCNDDYKR